MLISCVAYQDGRKLADIEPQDIHRYLVQPGCFVWVALLEPDARALEQMQAEYPKLERSHQNDMITHPAGVELPLSLIDRWNL